MTGSLGRGVDPNYIIFYLVNGLRYSELAAYSDFLHQQYQRLESGQWRSYSSTTSFAETAQTATAPSSATFSQATTTAESVGATEQASWQMRSGGKEENTHQQKHQFAR